MPLLANPRVAAAVATAMQRLGDVATGPVIRRGQQRSGLSFPEYPARTRDLTIPTSVAPARTVVYEPAPDGPRPPVYVNFHGGGYVMRGIELDDPLCRYLAAEAGAVVVNVDYVVAPRYPFPAPTRQAYEVVQWVAAHGAEQGWAGDRLIVGGQSAGGGLAAAVARQALDRGGPAIALQVLHYPPLDLATPARTKRSTIDKPMLRPWMADVFDNAYVPDPAVRADPLVSPANPADTADLTGIAPALVITPEYDLLRAEGERYAQRLGKAGALLEHRLVPGADHAYDMRNAALARDVYGLIADRVREVGTA
ncbi:MAG TPA: alpha/beta hydrolase fold domain-containing protein [Rugosimonospora sp.]|nr:alpha/beta hydrolase fold domain-containing protein [Rugosimonospora sp.]